MASGYHNGTAFPPEPWQPTSVGETLSWSGTSTADLAQGALLFSAGAYSRFNFEVAHRLSAVNLEPTLNPISYLTINEDAGPQTVTLAGISAGGGEIQSLTVTATSSNPGLIPNMTVTYTSPSTTGSLVFTPFANANGAALITVTVNDGQSANNTAVRSFWVAVNPVNDPPTIDAVSPLTIDEDAGPQTVNLAGISAGGGENDWVTVSALSTNTDLIPSPTVTYTSPSTTGSLELTPVANANGNALIQVIVLSGYGSNILAVRTLNVTVNAVNDAPTLAAISPLTIDEDAGPQTLNLAGISAGGGETQSLTVTATSSNTGLIPNPTVTYTSPRATDTLGFTPVANVNGTATITVTVEDGQAANNSIVRTFPVTVNAVNDAPTDIALAGSIVPERQINGTVVGSLSSSDPDTGSTFIYTLVSGAGSTDNGSFQIVGDSLQTSANLNFRKKNLLSIRVSTTDQGLLSTEKTFPIFVTDLPEMKNDFDGDGRSDIGCYYPTDGNWYEFRSTDGFWQTQFGNAGTLPVTGDFDGDGKADFGHYSPATGKWQLTMSTDGFWETTFGFAGTTPVVGDFDGDVRDDIGCYYPTGGNWYVFKSTEGFWQTQFGYAGTIPVVGDFDGDGRDDIGCYYPPGGNWYIFQSRDGFWQTTFGYGGTIPVIGDFDGDGRSDIGCYYPPGGNWYVFKSTDGFWQTTFGYAGTEPVVGDFDGDDKSDLGCYYPAGGNWYVFKSTEGFWQTQFGYEGTIPLGGTLR